MMYLGLAILALLVGSFLNVIIYRLPKILEYESRLDCAILLNQAEPEPLKLNLWAPRSFCPACKHQISAFSNIPLLSYLIQRGKCKHCNASIAMQYPAVELATLLLSLFAAWHFNFTLTLAFALGFIWILIPLFVIDLKHRLLPDSLTLSLLWLGLLANTQELFTTLPEAVYGAVIGYLILWSLIQIFYFFTGKVGMGHGDLKLFAALGAWFGLIHLPLILLIASIAGVIGGLYYLNHTHQSRNTPIPFGPFLAATGVLVMFYGHEIVGWYMRI
jgi:leader peptidase (prepilin peptidase)/N-methyltransferase